MKNLFIAVCFLSSLFCVASAEAGNCTGNSVSGDSAVFVTQSVPNSMQAGRSYPVSVTFCNNGTTTWNYVAPPANGSYVGTTVYIRLGSQFPQDNTNWGLNRVNLSPGDNITPGMSKTFSFNVTAPLTSTAKTVNQFKWGMVRERVSWFAAGANQLVASFYTPAITLQNKPIVAPVTIPASGFSGFSYTNFAGANAIGRQYRQPGSNTHTTWIPSDYISVNNVPTYNGALTDTMNNAKAMNLKVVRLTIVIPPDAAVPQYSQYNSSDWNNWVQPVIGTTTNATNVQTTIKMANDAMSAASSAGLKVILTLDGYTEYDNACTHNNLWKKSFNSVRGNAATIVKALSTNPALYAWDILNEPLWNAEEFGCLDIAPTNATYTDYATETPYYNQIYTPLTLPNANAMTQSITEVVEAVHAMYNLVRQNDAFNHPTTVGEGTAAYVSYWTDISSFVSPHLYVDPQDIISAQVAANNAAIAQSSTSPLFTQFTGAPTNAFAWQLPQKAANPVIAGDQVLLSQIPAIATATIAAMKNSAVTVDSVPLPLIIGEYGTYSGQSPILGGPANSTDAQRGYYSLYLPVLSGGTQSLTTANIGGLFWDFHTMPTESPNYSMNNGTFGLLLAACTVANSLGASPTCYPQ